MSDTPRTDEAQFGTGRVSVDFARQLERELNEALAANAELLERLQEARESHIIATARKVQTIQQQAVEIDRLKGSAVINNL
jgi:hypothetical protein